MRAGPQAPSVPNPLSRAAVFGSLFCLALGSIAIGSSFAQSAPPQDAGTGVDFLTSILPDAEPGAVAPAPSDSSEPQALAAPADGSVSMPGMAGDACQPCSPLPATTPEPASAQAEGSAAAAAGPGGAEEALTGAAANATAAAQSLRRSPGLTPVPASRRMAPPPSPSPTTIVDQRNWQAIDRKGIQVITVGEAHADANMIQSQRNFLQSAYTHGARTVVIEYPKSEQGRLNRYLDDPSYRNMAEALSVLSPDTAGLKGRKRAEEVSSLAQALEAVDLNPRQAQQTYGWNDATLALAQANIRMARNWRFAHGKGFSVEGGDVAWNVGLDKGTGTLVTRDPTPQEVLNYVTSVDGMTKRNESIAQTAAMSTARGRVVVLVGGAHTGFLPEEHLLGAPPHETYPGINYLLETRYRTPSVALAQNQISPQGYLAQSAVPEFGAAHMNQEQANQRMAAEIAQDPYRTPISPNQPIEESLPDAVARREKALPQLR